MSNSNWHVWPRTRPYDGQAIKFRTIFSSGTWYGSYNAVEGTVHMPTDGDDQVMPAVFILTWRPN